MWSSAKQSFIQVGWMAVGVLSVFGAWKGISQVIAIDALARFRANESGWGRNDGIILSQTQFASWNKGDKVASATANRLVMSRDRSSLTLDVIRKGRIFSKNSPPIEFEAQSAQYEMYQRKLSSSSSTRIKSKDFDLKTDRFQWEERTSLVEAPGQITGKLGEGTISAKGLKINLKTGDFKAGAGKWVGLLALQEAKPAAPKKRWEIVWTDIQVNGDLRVYLGARATDGEVIVKAPRIEHNTKTDVVVATGGARYWGLEANISAPKVVVYRKESRVLATGGINMLLKAEKDKGLKEEELPEIAIIPPDKATDGKPITRAEADEDQKRLDDEVRSSNNARQYPTAIRADEITYWYKEGQRRAVIKGSPQARQELAGGRWRMVWAESALYDGEGDWLTMKSSPGKKEARLRSSIGDDFIAEQFKVSTKEKDERWSATKGQGVTYVDDEDTPTSGGNRPPRQAASTRGR